MTRAKDISKILTDANISGTLDVSGAFTSQGIDDNADAVAITIDNSERVGIGTTVPTEKLVLANSSNLIKFGLDGSSHDIFSNGKTFNIGTTDDTVVRMFQNNSEVFRLSGGNVSIGTTSGSAGLTVTTSLNDNWAGRFENTLNTGFGGLFVTAGASSAETAFEVRKNTSDTALKILGDGNVGIGTSSPLSKMHLSGTSTVFLMERTGQSSGTGQFAMHMEGSNSNQITMVYDDGGKIVFGTASNPTNGASFSEKMNLDSAGTLNIGTSSPIASSKVAIEFDGTNFNGLVLKTTRSAINSSFLVFRNSSDATIGSVSQNATSSVAYNTSSDYRLKENVSYDFDATTRLKQLKPCRFNFIADADTTVDGFLAHEVSSIVPEAISGEKDALEDDGKIKPQGIDHGKIVPLLVKTIQELEARITALEGA